MTNTAIILCGGMATRLGELAKNTPKILMFIKDDYTILDAQLDLLSQNGVHNVVLATGHLGEQIREYMEYATGRGRHSAFTWQLSNETEPLGTGGAFLKAWNNCVGDKPFVGMNGDVYCPDLDIRKMIDVAEGYKHMAGCIAMKTYDIPFGTLSTREAVQDGFHFILDFKEKQPARINAGVYYIKPALMQYGMKHCSIEKDVFPHWKDHLLGFDYDGPWFDVGTPESLRRACEFVNGN